MRNGENAVPNGSLWFSDALQLNRVFIVINASKDERFIVNSNGHFDGLRTSAGLRSIIDQCCYKRLG